MFTISLSTTGFPIVNDPLYNHVVFGPQKGKDGQIGKTDEDLIRDLISIHNAENWLGGEGDDFSPGFFSSNSSVGVPSDSLIATPTPTGVSTRSPTPTLDACNDPKEAVIPPASLAEPDAVPIAGSDASGTTADRSDAVAANPEAAEGLQKEDDGNNLL